MEVAVILYLIVALFVASVGIIEYTLPTRLDPQPTKLGVIKRGLLGLAWLPWFIKSIVFFFIIVIISAILEFKRMSWK